MAWTARSGKFGARQSGVAYLPVPMRPAIAATMASPSPLPLRSRPLFCEQTGIMTPLTRFGMAMARHFADSAAPLGAKIQTDLFPH
jgi:hypothetical protein